jgi:hypothetical protein
MSNRLLALAVAAMALASCSGGTSGVTPTVASPESSLVSSIGTAANAACPVIGKTIVHDKTSAKVVGATVSAGGVSTLNWTVAYNGLTKQESEAFPPIWKPELSGCGQQTKGIGTIKQIGVDFSDFCLNGTCNGYVKLTMQFTPPAKLPGNKAYTSVVVKFVPPPKSKQSPFYGIVYSIKPA